jgi:hypothetical protein
MGLLDMNPQDEALLTLGLSLLNSKGSFGNAVGQAGMQSLQTLNQAKDRQRMQKMQEIQEQMARLNLEQANRQSQMQKLPGQFFRPQSAPVVDATGGMDTAAENPNNDSAGRMDWQGYSQALAGMDPLMALQLQQSLTKAKPKPLTVGANERVLDPETYKELVPALPDQGKQSGLSQLISEMNALPPNDPRRAIYMDKIRKESTHQPPVSVSYGAPVAGVDAKGDAVFFQPSKDGRTAPSIVQGVKPAPQNRDTKLPAELQRMQIAGDAMGALLNDYEAMLKKHNPRDPLVQANPAVRAEMQSLKRNLELQFKELQALGALAGPDIEIMRQALSDPFTLGGAYYGREGLLSQVAQARSLLQKRKDAVMRSQGKEAGPTPKAVKRTGTLNGRKVVEYEDGSVEYAD